MAGYYVPSAFSANYVANKKNEDGVYKYDSAVNTAGIDAQRNLQQLNKQYNVTINNAYAQNLFANRGLQASALGSGYKEAFAQNLQTNLDEQINQVDLSVGGAKQSIFKSLAASLGEIGNAQVQEINNMRRMAGSLEQYHDYVKTLRKNVAADGVDPTQNNRGAPGNILTQFEDVYYTQDHNFKMGDEWTFEDNYDQLFSTQKGIISNYIDDFSQPGLSYEDWLRQNSGSSDKDTSWLDWVYGGGMNQYKDFIKNGVNRK